MKTISINILFIVWILLSITSIELIESSSSCCVGSYDQFGNAICQDEIPFNDTFFVQYKCIDFMTVKNGTSYCSECKPELGEGAFALVIVVPIILVVGAICLCICCCCCKGGSRKIYVYRTDDDCSSPSLHSPSVYYQSSTPPCATTSTTPTSSYHNPKYYQPNPSYSSCPAPPQPINNQNYTPPCYHSSNSLPFQPTSISTSCPPPQPSLLHSQSQPLLSKKNHHSNY